MTDLDFAFLDAVIRGDMDEALRLAYEYQQGEQLSLFEEAN